MESGKQRFAALNVRGSTGYNVEESSNWFTLGFELYALGTLRRIYHRRN